MQLVLFSIRINNFSCRAIDNVMGSIDPSTLFAQMLSTISFKKQNMVVYTKMLKIFVQLNILMG
uniref:Uncharacterized protein n=1 Tax=Aegilops tauschii subsp. strangulata TaxID=200361 RepID=A0A453CUP6_AEGTS